jgi:hypothetical protein
MSKSFDAFDVSPQSWNEGYFKGVSAVAVNTGIMFEQVAASGQTFQAAAFLNVSGWLDFARETNFYCFGFTCGMYDSGSLMLKSEVVDVFNSAAYEEYEILRRAAVFINKTILADFKMFYNERNITLDGSHG